MGLIKKIYLDTIFWLLAALITVPTEDNSYLCTQRCCT